MDKRFKRGTFALTGSVEVHAEAQGRRGRGGKIEGRVKKALALSTVLCSFWLVVSVLFFVLVFTPHGYKAHYCEGQNND